MKRLLFLFLIYTFQFVSSQELLMNFEVVTSSDILEPKFNGGGIEKFYEFLIKEFDKSTLSKPGTILISFVVNSFGELKEIKVLEFPNIEAASEIIRVLNLSPKWESAKRAGKPFNTEIKIPLKFYFKN